MGIVGYSVFDTGQADDSNQAVVGLGDATPGGEAGILFGAGLGQMNLIGLDTGGLEDCSVDSREIKMGM